MAKPRVLIVGAGIGGIALGQALRKRGIPFSLFERDASEHARFQGWALSLHDWIISDLLQSTTDNLPDLHTVSTTGHLGIPTEGAGFNGPDMKELWRHRAGPDFQFIRADRRKLREWLSTDIDINWNKKLTHYEQDSEGVEAFFEDGSSAKGDILVGADGVGSRVRNQLLQNVNIGLKQLDMGAIVGEMTASEEQYQRWRNIAESFYVGGAKSSRIFVGVVSVAEDQKTARYYWGFNWYDDQASQENYWTAHASKEELHSYVMNSLDDLHPDLTEPIRKTPVDGILQIPLLFKDMVPPELPTGRVTLLGDAVHPMTPFRGEGGNHAMKDGLSLARFISASLSNDKRVEDVLKDYENEMRPRVTESVLKSRAASWT